MDTQYRFASLVHSKLVADTVYNELVSEGWNINIKVTSYDSALTDAQQLFDEGYEIILCHGGFREQLFSKFGSSIVAIERTDIDLLHSLKQAREISKTVALTAHINEQRDIAFMEELLDMHIIPVRYNTATELEKQIRELFGQGVHTFVGGGGTGRFVNRYGGRTFLDVPSPTNIRKALSKAIVLADKARIESIYHQDVQSIIQHSREGVIYVGHNGKIIFHNQRALEYLHVSSPNQLTELFEPLLLTFVLNSGESQIDKLVSIRGEHFLINTIPLVHSAKTFGAVCFLTDVSSVQKMTRKIGVAAQARGFISLYTNKDILGHSEAISVLKKTIQLYAPTDLTIHIHGETGSGKELVAHSLHSGSMRKNQPFVVVNCSALPDHLLESELFGYEEGAFTGARRGGKPGLIELADGGTLFLDEIGDISPAIQLRLLRVLDTKQFMHIGGDRFLSINVRVVSASHKDLDYMVQNGSFRSDLYFRLTGTTIEVPPLRERKEDIADIVRFYLLKRGCSESALSKQILQTMQTYKWYGNVRELISVIENYAVLLKAGILQKEAFFQAFYKHKTPGLALNEQEINEGSYEEKVATYRKNLALEALKKTNGDKTKTSQILGISYSSLRRILMH